MNILSIHVSNTQKGRMTCIEDSFLIPILSFNIVDTIGLWFTSIH